MHQTLSESFKGYVDNFYTENGNIRISGWLVTTAPRQDVVYYVDNGNDVAFYNYNERQDVADFYKTENRDYLNCGFDICIPQSNKSKMQIYALVKGQKEVVFDLDLASQRRINIESNIVNETIEIQISKRTVPSLIVVDNFYENPDAVRKIALEQSYSPDLRYHKGQRTTKKFIAEGTKQIFESLIGRRITNWVNYEYNGIFQFCTAEDPIVYHSDEQNYAAAVYLTPDAPLETGTSFYRSKEYPNVKKIHTSQENYKDVFKGGFYDKTKFELIDTVGNVYNRLALWDARLIHSASNYFGTNKNDSRLFHLFFFDIEE